MRTHWNLYYVLLFTSFFTLTFTTQTQAQENTTPQFLAKDVITNFDLQQKIIDTYRKLDDYQVHKTVNIHDTVGAVSQKSKHEVNIALDRSNKSIAI